MCAFEFAGDLLETEPARPRTRQFIGGRGLQVVCRFRPVPERLSAFTGCLLSIGGRSSTVVGCFGSIRRRSRPVPPRPDQDVLATRVLVVLQIVQTSQLITTSRAAITKRRSPITLLRRSQPRRGTLIAYRRDDGAVASGPLARQSAAVMRESVSTSREIIVGSVLILIRASLIALTGALVVIRPRLVLITGGLVAIRPRLILVALGLRELGAAGRTTGNLSCFAAGRTPYYPLHHLSFPELAIVARFIAPPRNCDS
jgi:hypothetical protein